MTAGDLEGVPGVVIGPPGFVDIDGTPVTKGFLSANRCLLGGHLASRHAVNQHFVARHSDTTVVVEILEPEIPVCVRNDAGVEH